VEAFALALIEGEGNAGLLVTALTTPWSRPPKTTRPPANLPFGADDAPRISASVLSGLPVNEYPHVAEVITHVMQHGRVEDFELGLDLDPLINADAARRQDRCRRTIRGRGAAHRQGRWAAFGCTRRAVCFLLSRSS
jgi:hypothetical protein